MEHQMSLSPISMKLSWMERLKGIFTVIIAYIALRCLSLAMIRRILSIVKPCCSREIGIDEAEIAWGAVHQFISLFLGRVACLEVSLAFVLFALSKGLSATWCVGVAIDPFRAHAWVEIGGKPFHEADYFEQHFRRLFAV